MILSKLEASIQKVVNFKVLYFRKD